MTTEIQRIIADYITRKEANEQIKYDKPVDVAIKEVIIEHPEARLKSARKVLAWLIVTKYSQEFRLALYQNPKMLEELLNMTPDFDTILREMRHEQNDEGKYSDEMTNDMLKRHAKQVSEYSRKTVTFE